MIGTHTVVRMKSEVISSEIDGSAVMMSVENGEYYGMNAVASDIWSMLKNPTSVGEIVSLLRQQYEIDQERCEREIIAFLTKLLENGLIETAQ